jgi:site-specific recombinase XerD
MGEVKKIGDEYFIEFYARGLLYQKKAGKDSKAAEILLQEIEDKIQKGELATLNREVDMDVFFFSFLEFIRKEYTPKTFARYQNLIEHFNTFLEGQDFSVERLSQITPFVIECYRTQLMILVQEGRIKPGMLNFSLYLLRDVLEYALKLGYLNDNPTLHVRFVNNSSSVLPKVLGEGDVAKCLQNSRKDLKDFLEVLLNTGMLLREGFALCWEDVNLKDGYLQIKPFKKGIVRTVPLSLEVRNVFLSLKGKGNEDKKSFIFWSQELNRHQQEETVKKYLEESDFSLALFRNTFIQKMLEKKVSLIQMGRLLGFDDVAKAWRYWKLKDLSPNGNLS